MANAVLEALACMGDRCRDATEHEKGLREAIDPGQSATTAAKMQPNSMSPSIMTISGGRPSKRLLEPKICDSPYIKNIASIASNIQLDRMIMSQRLTCLPVVPLLFIYIFPSV